MVPLLPNHVIPYHFLMDHFFVVFPYNSLFVLDLGFILSPTPRLMLLSLMHMAVLMLVSPVFDHSCVMDYGAWVVDFPLNSCVVHLISLVHSPIGCRQGDNLALDSAPADVKAAVVVDLAEVLVDATEVEVTLVEVPLASVEVALACS